MEGGAILAGKDGVEEGELGNNIGYIFQLTDDLLDSDDNAFSILNVTSKENAMKILKEKAANALQIANKIDKFGFLTDLINYICQRTN